MIQKKFITPRDHAARKRFYQRNKTKAIRANADDLPLSITDEVQEAEDYAKNLVQRTGTLDKAGE